MLRVHCCTFVYYLFLYIPIPRRLRQLECPCCVNGPASPLLSASKCARAPADPGAIVQSSICVEARHAEHYSAQGITASSDLALAAAGLHCW